MPGRWSVRATGNSARDRGAPGASASDRMPSFAAVGQCRRRFTPDMTSGTMRLTLLSHVLKDNILHLTQRGFSKPARAQSCGGAYIL